MDVSVIKKRLESRIEELGLNYNQIDKAIGCREGWLSGVLKGKQKSIKTDHLKALCKTLAVSEAWLRAEDLNSPSLFVIAPPPSKKLKGIAPLGAGKAEFLAHQKRQIDEEIAAIKSRLQELKAQRQKIIEAEQSIKGR